MLKGLDCLQIALIMLMGVSLMLIVTTLCKMAAMAIKRIFSRHKSEPSFSDLHQVLSTNEISYQQANQKLNDYQS